MSIERFSALKTVRRRRALSSAQAAFSFSDTILLVFTCVLVAALALSACSRKRVPNDEGLSKRVVQYGEPVPKGGGRYKVGNPYKIAGRRYTPREDPGYNRTGVASWYGDLFHGRYTANGEIFDMDALTAAHPTLPLPSYVRVTNLENRRSLVLRVNDRGPYAHDRIIDLSRRSAQALGFQQRGTARVRVQYLGRAPLDGDDSLERRVYASQPWAQHASLDGPVEKNTKRTRLAQAAREAVQADPMIVGSLPDDAQSAPQDAKWATAASAAPAGGKRERGEAHFVQAASFNNREFAVRLGESFADLGGVSVTPAKVGGKTWYRVRVGPFGDRHDADEALRAVVGKGMTDARIVEN